MSKNKWIKVKWSWYLLALVSFMALYQAFTDQLIFLAIVSLAWSLISIGVIQSHDEA